MNKPPKNTPPKNRAFFWPARLLRWGLAEILCSLGNLAHRSMAIPLWGWSVHLNQHQEVAAMNRATALFECDDQSLGNHVAEDITWAAFETVLEQLKNPWNTSASDLYLSRTPGRLARRMATRALWGPAASKTEAPHDEQLKTILTRLAKGHFRRGLAEENLDRAERALETLGSLIGPKHLDVLWGRGELAWCRDEKNAALEHIRPPAEQGDFASPLDSLRWAERALAENWLQLTETCLAWGRRFLPEESKLWYLLGELAWRRGQAVEARVAWNRALALDPQDLATVLALEDSRGASVSANLEVQGPTDLPLGTSARFACLLSEDAKDWVLRVLPPAGRGVMPHAIEIPFDRTGHAEVEIFAHRPHRVRGEPWPLVFLALGPQGYSIVHHVLRVTDNRPGRLILSVTEDHEIHEERGHLGQTMLRRLLVDKSRFASQSNVPWTHMVETGSTLAMQDEASSRGDVSWRRLGAAVRKHLAEEVARGNDLQPHLHTFNDPAYSHFPYHLSQDGGEQGWQPHLRFLLTAAQRRGDWASVCPPPARASEGPGPNRLASVERAVAQLEAVGRLGSPDYRPILWRSGLLEYGDTTADRAWSSVALRRAGLLADSDQPKPVSARVDTVSAAFPADWEEPFTPCPGGPLLQLPIAANLEGDYLMGSRRLRRRALASLAATQSKEGLVRPGVHLFTLLTHDKFLNARRGREEFCLDRDYGDWPVVDLHLAAWQGAGAEIVTARQGVEAVLDDLTWQPLPRLLAETFVMGSQYEVRYDLHLLGKDIPVSEDFPHELLIPVPCSLREHLKSIRLCSSLLCPSLKNYTRGNATNIPKNTPRSIPRGIEPEMTADNTAFWLPWQGGELPTVCFVLEQRIGPELLRLDPAEEGCWTLEVAADEPFHRARLLLPWELGLPDEERLRWQVHHPEVLSESPSAPTHGPPVCHHLPAGLLLENVAFEADDLGRPTNLVLKLAVDAQSDPQKAAIQEPSPSLKVSG
jgi:tetratricopeptide (TPR) repeat protein